MLMRTEDRPSGTAKRGWGRNALSGLADVGLLGAAALVVLLLLVAAGFVLAWRSEREDRRVELINDALWVEQTLRFAIDSGRSELDRVASDLRRGLPREALPGQIDQFRRLHPEMARVTYAEFLSGVQISSPNSDPRGVEVILDLDPVVAALKVGEPRFGAPYQDNAGNWRFDLAVPVVSSAGGAALIASYGINELLNAHIPWWVARKNHVEVQNASGDAIGTKSAVESGLADETHVIPFDPPGHGLVIVVRPYETQAQWARFVLPVTIALFAAAVGASLLFLQRSVRERQKAEQRARAETAFRRSMEEALTVGMRARDREGRIIYANQAFCDMVGWSQAELIGHAPPMPYWDSDNIEETVAIHDSILAGEVPSEGFEIRFRRRNGEPLDALIYEAPLNDAAGKHVGWMASILDVTERKRMAEISKAQADDLARTARLVSMGEMASTLAHELNQPLTAISTYATGLAARAERGTVQPEQLREVLGKLSQQSQRAGEIIRHLRDFVRRSAPKMLTVDLRDVAQRTVGFLEADLAHKGVSVAVDLAPEACPVTGDDILLEQVILNLLRNAGEAVERLARDRRTITLSVRRQEAMATLSVRDLGPGVPQPMKDQLFVPFMSSKATGMGMGLNICRSIVELHRGRIWQEDAAPGCIFHVSIPLAEESAA